MRKLQIDFVKRMTWAWNGLSERVSNTRIMFFYKVFLRGS